MADESCGLTVNPGDSRAMAEAICRFVDDSSLRDEMARNARRVAEEQFDRDILAERMRKVLAEAAGRSVDECSTSASRACAA